MLETVPSETFDQTAEVDDSAFTRAKEQPIIVVEEEKGPTEEKEEADDIVN